MKVTDNVTIAVRTRKGIELKPIEFTYAPQSNGMDAVQVKYRGFKQAALLNPKKVEAYGVYEMTLRFIEYFFGEFMGYGACTASVSRS